MKEEKYWGEIPNKDRIIWINLNNGLQFNGIKEDLPIIENFIEKAR